MFLVTEGPVTECLLYLKSITQGLAWNYDWRNLFFYPKNRAGCLFFRGLETGQVLGRVNMVSGHVKTQLIAHDKEVYDIAFSKAGGGRDMFASVGADGKINKLTNKKCCELTWLMTPHKNGHPL